MEPDKLTTENSEIKFNKMKEKAEILEKSVLIDFLGDYPAIRVLDFLLTFDEFDYSKKDISIKSNVAWNTINLFWDSFIEKKMVVRTRKVGKTDMYKLNKENLGVKKLIELEKILMKMSLDKQTF